MTSKTSASQKRLRVSRWHSLMEHKKRKCNQGGNWEDRSYMTSKKVQSGDRARCCWRGTLKPSQVQEPNFKTQVCTSYGKNSTSMEQEDLYTAGGCQTTNPVQQTVALVISVTSQFPSALESPKKRAERDHDWLLFEEHRMLPLRDDLSLSLSFFHSLSLSLSFFLTITLSLTLSNESS